MKKRKVDISEKRRRKLHELLSSYLRRHREEAPEADIERFQFHMTDWIDDLEALHRLYTKPETFTEEKAEAAIDAFLIHATSHIEVARWIAGQSYASYLAAFVAEYHHEDRGEERQD